MINAGKRDQIGYNLTEQQVQEVLRNARTHHAAAAEWAENNDQGWPEPEQATRCKNYDENGYCSYGKSCFWYGRTTDHNE